MLQRIRDTEPSSDPPWGATASDGRLCDLVHPFKGRRVKFLWLVEEGGVSAMIPHVEFHVLEVTVHEFLQFVAENVLVHGPMKDEERKLVLDGEKRGFVLSSREGKQSDSRVLPRGTSHPCVLGQLRHLFGVCDARLDELFDTLAPLVKVVGEEPRDELNDPGVGDFSVHAPPGEPSSDDDTGDSIRAMVTQDISGNDGSDAPPADERLVKFVFIDNGLEVIRVSLRVIILSIERLITLTMSTRVVTDEVEVFEEFAIIELFLKCQSGTRETGDEDHGRFSRVAGSVCPNFSTVLGLYELSEGSHGED